MYGFEVRFQVEENLICIFPPFSYTNKSKTTTVKSFYPFFTYAL
jgi:hypothetical protein